MAILSEGKNFKMKLCSVWYLDVNLNYGRERERGGKREKFGVGVGGTVNFGVR